MKVCKPFSDIEFAGDSGVIVYFDEGDVLANHRLVSQCQNALLAQQYHWLVDVIPSYNSVLVYFNLETADHHDVYRALVSVNWQSETESQAGKHHVLPVFYGANGYNDFALISRQTGLTDQQIIQAHTQDTLRVYAVGFAPGFGYLAETPKGLSMPRMKEPRKRVPPGAVAIADRQTAVYPAASPGGWHLLGVCPVPMIQPNGSALLATGDTVRFYAVDKAQAHEIATQHGMTLEVTE